MDVETHAYENSEFYEDGLRYKREHPEKIVILICASSKAGSTAQNVKWLGALKQEKVTIIKTLNWFEPNETMDGIQAGGCHHLEELAKQGNASLLAASSMMKTFLLLVRYSHCVHTCPWIKRLSILTKPIFAIVFSLSFLTALPARYSVIFSQFLSTEPVHRI